MKIKKSLSFILALIMLIGVVASTNVFAVEESGTAHKVESKLKAEKGWFKARITGTVNVSKTIRNEKIECDDSTYNGDLVAEVKASDLFAGVYKIYQDEFENASILGRKWKNIVMYGKDENSFPSATFTVTFPNGVNFKKADIEIINKSKSISSIVINDEKTDVTKVEFTFNLGNWNDYGGFFDLVKEDMESLDDNIKISIPYTIDLKENKLEEIGNITGEGDCILSYFGKRPVKNPVVSIDVLADDVIINK